MRNITAQELLALARYYTLEVEFDKAKKYTEEEVELQAEMNRD